MNVSDLHHQLVFHLGFHMLQITVSYALCGTLCEESCVLVWARRHFPKQDFFLFFIFLVKVHTPCLNILSSIWPLRTKYQMPTHIQTHTTGQQINITSFCHAKVGFENK